MANVKHWRDQNDPRSLWVKVQGFDDSIRFKFQATVDVISVIADIDEISTMAGPHSLVAHVAVTARDEHGVLYSHTGSLTQRLEPQDNVIIDTKGAEPPPRFDSVEAADAWMAERQ
jgi:hypothetical protein